MRHLALFALLVGCGARTAVGGVDAGPPAEVGCLDTTCTGGDVCCFHECTVPFDFSVACRPAAECPTDVAGAPWDLGSECDGPEDCLGARCCVTPTTLVSEEGICNGWLARCVDRCDPAETSPEGWPQGLACHGSADCPPEQACCACEGFLYPSCMARCESPVTRPTGTPACRTL